MRSKIPLLFFAAACIMSVPIIFTLRQPLPVVQMDAAQVNDIVKTLSEHWPDIQKGSSPPSFEYRLDYTLINNEGELIAATRQGLSQNINDAIQNKDTIVDITVNGEIAGKVIFYNDTADILRQNRKTLALILILTFIALAAILAGYTFYLYITLLRPFHKMKSFAGHIAAGNLDIPLEMDKKNIFGAFTESFDLMREELHKARENEHKADLSKKELVASLSHDIKTPVASIKAVTEYMSVTAKDEEDVRQLEIINMKAEQINALITNMFHAALEELQSLKVTASEAQSGVIPELIRNSDFKSLVGQLSIPSCIISADLLRLQQVFDNVITNSYKYAGTAIEVNGEFDGRYLVINIADFGAGVPEDEIPLLFKKFYRGKAAESVGGYGLGLHISQYLMQQMSGSISCENRPGGFTVRLSLPLA